MICNQIPTSLSNPVPLNNGVKNCKITHQNIQNLIHIKPTIVNNQNIKILYQNVRGLRTKIQSIYLNSCCKEFDIICITETWLHEDIADSELFHDDYQIVRMDRDCDKTKKKIGGGILVALKNEYVFNVKNEMSNMCTKFENVWIQIFKPLFIELCVIYFPPPQKAEHIQFFAQLLEKRVSDEKFKLIILGDFNIECIKDCNTDLLNSNSLGLELHYILNSNNLKSINPIRNEYNKTLDLVLCDESLLSDMEICKNAGIVDKIDKHHPPLTIEIKKSKKISKKSINKIFKYNFKNINWLAMSYDWDNINWNPLYNTQNVNEAFNFFYEKIYLILDKYAEKSTKIKGTYLKWWSKKTIILHKKKKRKMKTKPFTTVHQQQQIKIKTEFEKSLENDYIKFISNTSKNLKCEPKSFWNFIRSKKKKLIPKSFIINNRPTSNNEKIANEFSDFFKTVYNNESLIKTHHKPHYNEINKDLVNIEMITENDVKKAIKKLATNKGPGPDKIPAKIIKNASHLLTSLLSYLFTLAIKNSTFPSILKSSEIIPIPKKGNTQLVHNYRPINKINSFAKLFEIIIYEKIHIHIMRNITSKQHGFLKQKSTDTNLILFQNKIVETFNENKQLDVIYTDFEKFFDKIPFSTLINAMSLFGFTNKMTLFFETYFRNREMRVKYGDALSKPIIPTSGIPQGNKLSTLFAIMIINNITKNLKHSEGLIFADDYKIYKKISCTQDCINLQQDINATNKWVKENGLSFNIEKCEQMSYVKGKKIKFNYQYSLDNQNLKKINEKRDLGVIFEANGKFNKHIHYIIGESSKRLGLIKRHCEHIDDIDTIVLLFTSLVRSKLEYGALLWNPTTKENSKKLEQIQKRFVRYLFHKVNGFYPTYPEQISYKDLIDSLNIKSLEKRREDQAIIFIHKLCNNLINCPQLLSLIDFKIPNLRFRINSDKKIFNLDNTKIMSSLNIAMQKYNNSYEKLDISLNLNDLIKIIRG